MRLPALLAALLLWAHPALAAPKVVVSILPLHSIVAAVMGERGTPELLLQGRLSEHTASLTPRQIAALGKADIVFAIGGGLEYGLMKASGSEAVNGKAFVQLANAPGVSHLALRTGGHWEADADAPQPSAADAGDGLVMTFDPHVWLDPENAKAMARAVAADLAQIDPEGAAAYTANATTFASSLDGLTAELSASLAPVKARPYIVFHDAYHYFEHRFGLKAVGSISDAGAVAPTAARLAEMRKKLAETAALCVFREPQFSSGAVDVIIEGSQAKSGVLDGLGADLAAGPDAYAALLRTLAKDLAACLAG